VKTLLLGAARPRPPEMNSKHKNGTRNRVWSFVKSARAVQGSHLARRSNAKSNRRNGGVGVWADVLRASPHQGESVDPVQRLLTMKRCSSGCIAAVAFLFHRSTGCEDSGKPYRSLPALAPAATAAQAPPELPVLPLANPVGRRPVWLLPPVPAGRITLQEGPGNIRLRRADFQAGHLRGRAGKDF